MRALRMCILARRRMDAGLLDAALDAKHDALRSDGLLEARVGHPQRLVLDEHLLVRALRKTAVEGVRRTSRLADALEPLVRYLPRT